MNTLQVRFEEVSVSYGDKKVLENIDFTFPAHSLVSVLGPSGCGKSTTLMLISGLMFPTEGRIFFGDREVTKLDAVRRKVGMVFQNYALYPHLSVLENIMFPLKMAKVPKNKRRERALELANLVRIGEHIDKKPKQLSGGQQQRVAIARALAKEPSILLMDEPLSNLDARLRLEMREEIRRIQQQTNITTVFVTHDQEEALSLSDQIMVLNDGAIQQMSTPRDLYERPDNLFVASFLGKPAINMLPFDPNGRIRRMMNIPQPFAGRIETVGIRPECIMATDHTQDALFRGEVTHIERIGRDVSAKVRLDGAEMVVTGLPGEVEEGQTVNLTAGDGDLLFFDQSGRSVRWSEAGSAVGSADT
ncbi:ABC transporter ATP-binding protein [Bhargavaea cecembensis]|uniref:ABC transporter ATP-binding protein n=1 Tax=Bhargavaea cecembensis TaxID=394098 RepID=UPI00190F168D|nr:ABC transporter ATP-binding protein [Bhargavaea cecembensis]